MWKFDSSRVGLLFASLLIALGPAIAALPSWIEFWTPKIIGACLGIIGGVVLAWLTRSPLPREPWTDGQRANGGKP